MMEPIRVTEAVYVRDHILKLTFSDGLAADVDFTPWIKKHSLFEPLNDPSYFKNFSLDSWTVVWPNEAGVAPETLHSAALDTGKRHPA